MNFIDEIRQIIEISRENAVRSVDHLYLPSEQQLINEVEKVKSTLENTIKETE